MKRLLMILLSFHMVSQASSIIHKTIPYIGNSGSKAAARSAVSGMKNVDLSKLASDYWNHLKTKEGDYYLYSLITDDTLKNGNKRFGLTAEDVEQIKKFLLKFTMFNNTEYFAFSVLPKWLKEIYENKQDELIQKLETECNYGNWNLYKKEGFFLGILEHMVQNVWQNTKRCKQYLYVQKDHRYSYANDVSYLRREVDLIYGKYAYIADLEDLDESHELGYQYIILPQKDLSDQSYFNILAECLSQKTDATLLIAFQDSDIAIPVDFGSIIDSPFGFFLETIKIENIVIIGKKLQKIGDNFFYKNTHLKSLDLPDGIIQVGDLFLVGCRGLEEVKLSSFIKNIGTHFFYKCSSLKKIELPYGLTEVKDWFLYQCDGLEEIKLPSVLEEVESGFLWECSNLKSLELPDGLKEVGDTFLADCSELEEVKLPSSLKKTGKLFLAGCSALKEIKLPSGLNKVGTHFLNECSSLKSLELSDGLTEVGDSFLEECSGLEEVKLSSGLNKVGNHFLYECSSLKSLKLPDGLTEVGNSFLGKCSRLERVRLSSNLSQVGNYFLKECSDLVSLQLPNKLIQVGKYFLKGCTGLRVVFMSESLHEYLVNNNYVVPEIAEKIRYNSELMTYQEFYNKLLNPSDWDYLLNNQEKWHIENHIYLQDHQLKLGELEYLLEGFLKIQPKYKEIQNKQRLMIILTKITPKNRFSLELMTYQEFKDKLLDPSDWDYLLNNQEKWYIENHIYLQDHQLKVDELDNLLKSFLKIKSNKEDIQHKKRLMIILTNVLAKLENK